MSYCKVIQNKYYSSKACSHHDFIVLLSMPSAEMSLRTQKIQDQRRMLLAIMLGPRGRRAALNKLALFSQTAKGDKGSGLISPILLPKCQKIYILVKILTLFYICLRSRFNIFTLPFFCTISFFTFVLFGLGSWCTYFLI